MSTMLKIKAVLAKILNWAGLKYDWSEWNTENTTDTWVPVTTGYKIQHRVIPTEKTKTLTGTTNTQGAIYLGLTSSNMVRAVACTSDANYFGIPFKYSNNDWYAKIVDWQSMASQNNKSVTLVIYYA